MDLTQETFVKLYQARERYRPGGNFSTYLFTIAANLARNHARWKRRHPPFHSTPRIVGKHRCTRNRKTEPSRPIPAADMAERYAEVHAALLALPHDLREAITLFVYESMGYAEIAKLLRMPARKPSRPAFTVLGRFSRRSFPVNDENLQNNSAELKIPKGWRLFRTSTCSWISIPFTLMKNRTALALAAILLASPSAFAAPRETIFRIEGGNRKTLSAKNLHRLR